MTTVPIVTPEIEAYAAEVRQARARREYLPDLPAGVVPEWGILHSARVHTWPEVDVHIEGIPHGRGNVSVLIEETRTIVVEDGTDPDGTPRPIGLYTDRAPHVVITYNAGRGHEIPDIQPAEMRILGELLIELARDLDPEGDR